MSKRLIVFFISILSFLISDSLTLQNLNLDDIITHARHGNEYENVLRMVKAHETFLNKHDFKKNAPKRDDQASNRNRNSNLSSNRSSIVVDEL